MKKYIGSLVCEIILFQSSEALVLSQYYDFQKKKEFGIAFDQSTDLARGLVTLQHGALKEHRFFGNIKYDPYSMEDATVCSVNDSSDDAMTQLLILTFPSAGAAGFSAYGAGAIVNIFKDPDQLMQLIAGMFKIANEVREDLKTNANKETEKIATDDESILSNFGHIEIPSKKEMLDILSKVVRESKADSLLRSKDNKKQAIENILTFIRGIEEEDFTNFVETARITLDLYSKNKSNNDLLSNLANPQQGENALFYEMAKKAITQESGELKSRKQIAELIWRYKAILPVCGKKTSHATRAEVIASFESKLKKIDEETDKKIALDREYIQKYSNLEQKTPDELKNLIYENEQTKNSYEILLTKKKSKLIELGTAIVGAVSLERLNCPIILTSNLFKRLEEKSKWEKHHPYYEGYANDIICAYACSVINTNVEENLTKLANYLSLNKKVHVRYYSKLTEKMKEYYDKYPSYIPFDAGSTPISNGSGIQYENHKFADCVETTMRQLFAIVFCSKKGQDGNWTEKLRLETERIPESGKLHDFFQKYSQLSEIANGGSIEIRNAWAKVCSGHKNKIQYDSRRKICELEPEWRSMIRLFCLLMSEYDADKDNEKCSEGAKERKREAAKCIKLINKEDFEFANEQDVIDKLNILLGIRGDVKFEAINSGLSINSREKMVGRITICPKTYEEKGVEIKPDNNKTVFSVTNSSESAGHACVEDVMKVKDPSGRNMHNYNKATGLRYIWNLYLSDDVSFYPVHRYYLQIKKTGVVLDEKLNNIQTMVREDESGEYLQGIYRLCLSEGADNLHNCGILRIFGKAKEETIRERYLALGKVFFDSSKNNPQRLWNFWQAILYYSSNYIDLEKLVDQSTKEQLLTKWYNFSNVDDIKGINCLISSMQSVDFSVLNNIGKIADWKLDSFDWSTVGKIFNRIDFSKVDDAQYLSIKQILDKLQKAADKFVSSEDYARRFALNSNFAGRDEIFRLLLPFSVNLDEDKARVVKAWISEEEKRLNSGTPEGQERKKVDEKLIIPIINYISDDLLKNLLMNIINKAGKYFERDLRHMVFVCGKNEKRRKMVSDLIVANFPTGKTICSWLAGAIAGNVSDIPTFMTKINLKDIETLKTTFKGLGSKERQDLFVEELIKNEKNPEDLVKILITLFEVDGRNLVSRITKVFIKNNESIPMRLAKFLVGCKDYVYDWLVKMDDLYNSDDSLAEIINTLEVDRPTLADALGKAYVKKKGIVPMSTAKILIDKGACGEGWLVNTENLFNVDCLRDFLDGFNNHERGAWLANKIGTIYILARKTISMDVAKILVKARAIGYGWLNTADEVYKSDKNISEILEASVSNKGKIADEIGREYLKRNKSISMSLTKTLVGAGALGHGWLDKVENIYDSDNVIDILNTPGCRKRNVAYEIGKGYSNRDIAVSMHLAKALLMAETSEKICDNRLNYKWLAKVEELYTSEDCVIELLNVCINNKAEVASKIGKLCKKINKPSMNLAKILINAGSHSCEFLAKVEELYTSEDYAIELLNACTESHGNKNIVANVISNIYVDQNKTISPRLAKFFVESETSEYKWLSQVKDLFEPGNVDALLSVAGDDRDFISQEIELLRKKEKAQLKLQAHNS